MKRTKIIDTLSHAKILLATAKNHPDEAQIHIVMADRLITNALVLLTESNVIPIERSDKQ